MAPQRLLKLILAHHRNPAASEEECHRFITEVYIPKAVAIHQRHKLQGYSYHFSPTPVRNVLSTACERLQNGWTVDTHDATVEFYFRDIADLVTVSTDPDFIALQAIEAPYISKEGVIAQLGWVETYIADQQVVNLVDGKSQYRGYEEASSIELTL
ncbi:hypothetical protein N7491_008822 [Penicillium cf. griseofulvum]|uniref:EthD domain-containing protein n=1 Tax=Penicillium cf. griseofulvum TaxID=2972120 RepID=A0A9W9JRC5_9EURO|nr:hypothetical protein N7472_005580 [Penicillium cf. griseofulvum]KAJ5423606.1 hypothetical protein N7491_008822 [Penicillium cf. griseofulvum]KAJ5431141.1 hypothetical protein N7445_008873 [Penicillium cf. griseofulvum]